MSACKKCRPAGRAAAVLTLSLLASGCAGLFPAAPQPAVQSVETRRIFHDTIELGGRLSVRYQKNGKEESLHGSFTWSQNPSQTIVTLLSPLGQIIAMIDITAGEARLTQAGQAPRLAADVDALTAETLGWPLPIAGLRNWLQGFGMGKDGKPFMVTEQASTTALDTPDGWHIQYPAWQDDGTPGQTHPRRIDLARNTTAVGEVAIRVVIDSWQPPRISAHDQSPE